MSQRAFLRSPGVGYRGPHLEAAERVGRAFDKMLQRGETASARSLAIELATWNADFEPALLLRSQADFVDGHLDVARALLESWVGESPGFVAAQLLRARLAELEEDFVTAYDLYLTLEDEFQVAAKRRLAIAERAVEALRSELQGFLAGDRFEEARALSETLSRWQPDNPWLEEIEWQLAAAAGGHPGAELEALRKLARGDRRSVLFLERQAELELEIGDAEAGLRIFEELVSLDPGSSSRREALARGRFRWRLMVLPTEVLVTAESAELTRGDFATLLYWLIPGVRNAAGSGKIATDILDVDVERRREIARVVNRGLMEVDSVMHRFEPRRAIFRWEALESLLKVLVQSRPPAACVSELALNVAPSTDFLCRTATQCGLLHEQADCLASAPISGRETQELMHKTLMASAVH